MSYPVIPLRFADSANVHFSRPGLDGSYPDAFASFVDVLWVQPGTNYHGVGASPAKNASVVL